MANVKRRPRARSHHKIKGRRRKPNISELVYKFLSLGGNQRDKRTYDAHDPQCTLCRPRKRRNELLESLNSRVTHARNMTNKRRESSKNSKMHRVKRRRTSKDPNRSACMCKRSTGEGVKKMKRYIQKALDFGVESGYLIPKDAAYRVLRVSSDLVSDDDYLRNSRDTCKTVSRDRSRRRTPMNFESYEVQDARRRTSRRRRRSRSGSRRRKSRRRSKRGRRCSGSGTEEVVENDGYEHDNQSEKRKSAEDANGEDGNEQSNQPDDDDGEKTTADKAEESSDLSVDEDDTDDEEKKGDDTKKS
ncbi:PREDICTED: serine/arginine-rich splicing factor 11-like [Dufourea novaeangliae]|uniref:Uncharacterized protein n=1 Tax=Dufourea novaeangliae TaxID=178035 RepID=A0A154P5X3_DUFNO|nr:PREDICTED: serine/arginine-rich splicing factor 11-like [Dufourea novaeangliae]KZC06540.1 hypothetical protein WN55_10451 [Dufourea novaeangliae]